MRFLPHIFNHITRARAIKSILIALGLLSAQLSIAQNLEVGEVVIQRRGDSVTVEFEVKAAEKATARWGRLVIEPVIRRANTPVVGATTSERRLPAASVKAGERIDYRAVCRYEGWMNGADLVLVGAERRVCRNLPLDLGLAAENILRWDPKFDTLVIETPIAQPSAAHTFVEHTPFIAHAGDEIARKDALQIVFEPGSALLDLNLGDNREQIVRLIAAIRVIADCGDKAIERIDISGAAPHIRAVKRFLTDHSQIDPAQVRIHAERSPGARVTIYCKTT